jgi:hypothetical protein
MLENSQKVGRDVSKLKADSAPQGQTEERKQGIVLGVDELMGFSSSRLQLQSLGVSRMRKERYSSNGTDF